MTQVRQWDGEAQSAITPARSTQVAVQLPLLRRVARAFPYLRFGSPTRVALSESEAAELKLAKDLDQAALESEMAAMRIRKDVAMADTVNYPF